MTTITANNRGKRFIGFASRFVKLGGKMQSAGDTISCPEQRCAEFPLICSAHRRQPFSCDRSVSLKKRQGLVVGYRRGTRLRRSTWGVNGIPSVFSGPTENRTRISATPGRCRPVGPCAHIVQWTGRGIEPRSPRCKRGIFPLDEPPMFSVRGPSGI